MGSAFTLRPRARCTHHAAAEPANRVWKLDPAQAGPVEALGKTVVANDDDDDSVNKFGCHAVLLLLLP